MVIPCFSILVMTQQVFLTFWSSKIFSHHFLFGFDPPAPVSWMLAEHSLVDSLENIRHLNLSRVAPFSWMLVRTSFLSSAFSELTRDPKLREEISSLLCSRATRHAWSRFRRRRACIRSRPPASFRHGALLSKMIVRKKITEIHLLRNILRSECQRVGFFGVNKFDLDLGFQND